MIHRELDVEINKEIYYWDSKVVLGYIENESGRFYVYVVNSVQLFCKTTAPSQWRWHVKMANTRLKSAAEKTSNTNVNGQSLVPLDFVRELLKVQEDTIKVFFLFFHCVL